MFRIKKGPIVINNHVELKTGEIKLTQRCYKPDLLVWKYEKRNGRRYSSYVSSSVKWRVNGR